MKLRTLKKKSKISAALLRHYELGSAKQFIAVRHDSYHGLNISCNHPVKGVVGSSIWCGSYCQWYPLKGTPMVGRTVGYYEPEWTEHTAYEELCEHVLWDDRPATMTDDEWQRALNVTGYTEQSISDFMKRIEHDL